MSKFFLKNILFFSEFSKILKIFMILEINFQYFGKFRKKKLKKKPFFSPNFVNAGRKDFKELAHSYQNWRIFFEY